MKQLDGSIKKFKNKANYKQFRYTLNFNTKIATFYDKVRSNIYDMEQKAIFI